MLSYIDDITLNPPTIDITNTVSNMSWCQAFGSLRFIESSSRRRYREITKTGSEAVEYTFTRSHTYMPVSTRVCTPSSRVRVISTWGIVIYIIFSLPTASSMYQIAAQGSCIKHQDIMLRMPTLSEWRTRGWHHSSEFYSLQHMALLIFTVIKSVINSGCHLAHLLLCRNAMCGYLHNSVLPHGTIAEA